jgi:hypothetical protein
LSDLPHIDEASGEATGPGDVQTPESSVALAPREAGWFQRLTSVLFILFCFELGLFLLIYPWTDGWSDNYFAWLLHGRIQLPWHQFWDNSYVRGALSGLGIANLWIALTEVFHMFAKRHAERPRA